VRFLESESKPKPQLPALPILNAVSSIDPVSQVAVPIAHCTITGFVATGTQATIVVVVVVIVVVVIVIVVVIGAIHVVAV